MSTREPELLFSTYDLRATLDSQLQSVNDRVIKLDKRRFEAESDEMLAAEIASALVISPLELLEDEIYVSSQDVKVDVSQDWLRAFIDRSRPAYVDGVEVVYHVPFRGEKLGLPRFDGHQHKPVVYGRGGDPWLRSEGSSRASSSWKPSGF